MSWLILALISVFTVSIATVLERVLLKEDDSDPIGYGIVFQFLLGSIVLVFALLLHKFVPPDISGSTPFRFIISAILWAGTTAFGFKAIKHLSAAEVTILTSSSTVISIFLSLIFLNEVFDFNVALGTFLVLLSIFIVNSEKLAFRSKQGIGFALLSALCAGTAVVNDAVILNSYEVFSYVAIMSFLPGVVLILLFPKKLKQAKKLALSKTSRLMFVFSLFYAIQAVTYYLSYQSGAPISHLSPITKSSIILTVIFAAVFLNEKKNLPKKVLASIIVTVGVLLLG